MAECASFQAETGVHVHHWPEIVGKGQDFDMIASLAKSCDLVIAVCQSTIHACGAMGHPCWVLTPAQPAWRYGLKYPRMAWYGDHLKLYRQKHPATWEPVVKRVRADLTKFLAEWERKAA